MIPHFLRAFAAEGRTIQSPRLLLLLLRGQVTSRRLSLVLQNSNNENSQPNRNVMGIYCNIDGCPFEIPGWARITGDHEWYLGELRPSTWYEAEAMAKEQGPAAFLAEIDTEQENNLIRTLKKCWCTINNCTKTIIRAYADTSN